MYLLSCISTGKSRAGQHQRKLFGINFGYEYLKDKIYCLENQSSKKDTIIGFLSKQLTAPKHNVSHGNIRGSCSVVVNESNTMDNSINDTVNEA